MMCRACLVLPVRVCLTSLLPGAPLKGAPHAQPPADTVQVMTPYVCVCGPAATALHDWWPFCCALAWGRAGKHWRPGN